MRLTTALLTLLVLALPTQAARFPFAEDNMIEVTGGIGDGLPLDEAREAGALDAVLLATDLTAAGISALLNNAPPNDGASRGWTVALPAGRNILITEPIRIDWDPLPTGITHGGVTLDCNGSVIQMGFGGDDATAIVVTQAGPTLSNIGHTIRATVKNCKVEDMSPDDGERHRGVLLDVGVDWFELDNVECISFYRTNAGGNHTEVDSPAKKIAVGHRCFENRAEPSLIQVNGYSLLRADGAGFHMEFNATNTPGILDPSWNYTFGQNVVFCSGGLDVSEGAAIYVDIGVGTSQVPPEHISQTEMFMNQGVQFYGCSQSHFAGGTLSGTLILDAINAGHPNPNTLPWFTLGNNDETTTRLLIRAELTRSSPYAGVTVPFSSNIMIQLQPGARIPILDVHLVDTEVGSGFITDNTVTCASIRDAGGQDAYFRANSGAFLDAVDGTSELLEWRFRLDAIERDGQACFGTNTLFTDTAIESLDAYNSKGSVNYWGEQAEYLGSRRMSLPGFYTFVLKDALISPTATSGFSAAAFCATLTPSMTAVDASYTDRSGGAGFTEVGIDEGAAIRRTFATTATDVGLTHNDKIGVICSHPLGGHAGEIAVSESGRADATIGLKTGTWMGFSGTDFMNGEQFCDALQVPMFAHDVVAVLTVDDLVGLTPSLRIVESLTVGQSYKAQCGPFAAMDKVQAQGEVVAFSAGGRSVQGLPPGTAGNILESQGPATPPAFVPNPAQAAITEVADVGNDIEAFVNDAIAAAMVDMTSFGGLSYSDPTSSTTLDVADLDHVLITVFDTNGVSSLNVTPDHTTDDIQVDDANTYRVSWTLNIAEDDMNPALSKLFKVFVVRDTVTPTSPCADPCAAALERSPIFTFTPTDGGIFRDSHTDEWFVVGDADDFFSLWIQPDEADAGMMARINTARLHVERIGEAP